MSLETFKEIPTGLAALERLIGDTTEPWDARQSLWMIADNLSREATAFTPRGSRNSWVEMLYQVTSQTSISGTSTETIMVPDFTLNANYLIAGRSLRYTIIGDMSSAVTTPGSWTQRLRYGGVAGTIVGVGNAYTPDTAALATTVPIIVEWWLTVRTDGASGSVWCQGRQMTADQANTTAALSAMLMPASAPAAVTINTTTSNALSPTSAASLTTGSLRTNMAYLEALN